jgi:Fe-S-cluster containining protein
VRAYCLTIHAGYKCGHSGACCTAGWPIPIEAERVTGLRLRGLLHEANGRNRVSRESRDEQRSGRQFTVRSADDGSCAFYDADHGRLCSIQRDAGAELMPSACRNFPRVALQDPRGVFVTLSHFCPTAARLLLSAGRIAVVDSPPSLSLEGEVDGLDATRVLPPLLRPGMLMDLEGYSAWEREGLAVLDDRRCSARQALAIIGDATAAVREWRPGRETLAMRVARAFEQSRSILDAPRDDPQSPFEHSTKAFLAAHLFASWAAYQSTGLTAVVESLESALALLGNQVGDEQSFVEAVRATDLRLRHSGNHPSSHVSSGSLPALRRD